MNSFVNPDLSVSSSDATMLIPQPQETRIANRRVQMFAATVVDHFSDLLPIFRIQERQAARQAVLFLAQEIITTVANWNCLALRFISNSRAARDWNCQSGFQFSDSRGWIQH